MGDTEFIQILEHFVIDNDELNKLETLISEFNIFEAIGSVRQELRHSDFLAFLLNPAEKHNLDDRFLKQFLIHVLTVADEPPIMPIYVNVVDLSGATVERETQNIDILIHDAESGMVCIIENKIFSGEHSDQLNRYLTTVKKRIPTAKTIIPIFLTPDGDPPQDEDSPYIPIGYGDIANIIEDILQAQESMLGADVSTLMRHYITMLRRHIVSDSEIAELCRQIYRTHKSAIDLIIEHMPDIHQELADYLINLLKNEFGIQNEPSSKTRVRFTPEEWNNIAEVNTGIGWTGTDKSLAFEFYNSNNQLILYIVLGPVESENQYIRERLFNYAHSNKSIFVGCRPKLSKTWTMLYKFPILRKQDFEDADIDDLLPIIEQKWQRFLENDLPKIHEHIMDIHFG